MQEHDPLDLGPSPEWELPDPDDLASMLQASRHRQQAWLQACRTLASPQIPEEVLKSVPEDLWTVLPWGRRLVVVKCPPTSRVGMIHVPENARYATAAGWVLTVSPFIATYDSRFPAEGYQFHPLTLVGQLVAFGRWAGQTLPIAGMPNDIERCPVILNIADISAPIFSENEAYRTGVVHIEHLPGQLELPFSPLGVRK